VQDEAQDETMELQPFDGVPVDEGSCGGAVPLLALIAMVAGVLLLSAVLYCRPACATSIIAPPPAAMIDQADVIFTGTVKSVQAVLEGKPGNDGEPTRTLITLQVDKLKKGDHIGPEIEVVELGGHTQTKSVIVYGSPQYKIFDHVLVFAKKLPDGTMQTHLMDLGRVPLEADGTVRQIAPKAAKPGDQRLDVEAFKSAAGSAAMALPDKEIDPAVSLSESTWGPRAFERVTQDATVTATYNFMGGKWTQVADVVFDQNGDPTLGSTPSVNAMLSRAFGAWQANGAVSFQAAGNAAPQGFTCVPGKLLISFNDPMHQVEDPNGCSGVLAIGGFCGGSLIGGGLSAINGAALVFNDKWSTQCKQFWTMPDVEEIATHELGHTIGLAHSCEQTTKGCDAEHQDATMNWMAHFDGRASTLHTYDQGAVAALYGPASGGPTATPGPAPSPTVGSSPTASGAALSGSLSITEGGQPARTAVFDGSFPGAVDTRQLAATQFELLANGAVVLTVSMPAGSVKANKQGTVGLYTSKDSTVEVQRAQTGNKTLLKAKLSSTLIGAGIGTAAVRYTANGVVFTTPAMTCAVRTSGGRSVAQCDAP